MSLEILLNEDKIYAPLLGKWVVATPEEKLKQQFILRLVNHYGYDLEQLGQDVVIKNIYKADIGIWKNKSEKKKNKIPSIIIAAQCKAEHIKINADDYLIGYNFASAVKANFFIATNLKETKIFHIKEELTYRKLERLQDIPNASLLSDQKQINKFISETKTFTRDQFTALLSKCHNIIRNNDKLSPEAAFDEISKILFMKIMYERKSKEEMIFSKEKFTTDEKNFEERIRPSLKHSGSYLFDKEYLQYLFDETKREFENEELFEELDQIRIRKRSFEMIVEELEAFNLSNTSDDIKGIAFEEFLGRTFRGELGQFFTPRTIVDYMVQVIDPKEGELICDPCCGSGGFLINAFDYVRESIERDIQNIANEIEKTFFNDDYQKLSEKKKIEIDKKVNELKSKLHQEFDLKNKKGRLYKLSHDCIYGTDANPRMARTAKMNMIMHGDGHGGVHHHDGLLNVNGIFDGRFDVILTNPPFGSRVNKTLKVTPSDIPNEDKIKFYEEKYGSEYRQIVVKQIQDWAAHDNGHGKSRGKALLDLFDVGAWSGLTEVLFMERCLNLLKPGGRMGIVLPEGVLNNSALQKIREYIEGKAKLINITSIPQDVFIASGATVKPSLLFLKKFSREDHTTYLKITEDTTKEIRDKYQPKLDELKATFKKEEKKLTASKASKELRDLKKKYTEDVKQVEDLITSEIKPLIKERFDYPIPVIEVEKAGISSTGAPCENELEEVAIEFREYRKKANLWAEPKKETQYPVDEAGNISRLQLIDGTGVSEPEIFYGAYAD